jgi:translation initiation factor 2 beta subunit (eIF-2beta)/eIF-5
MTHSQTQQLVTVFQNSNEISPLNVSPESVLFRLIFLSPTLKLNNSRNMANENQPAAAMDSLLQALQVNIIPNQEYLLQGSVLDQHVQRVLHRFFRHFLFCLLL